MNGVYLKRAIAVDAWQFTNDADSYNLLHWINHAQYAAGRSFARWINASLIIPTLEGDMTASVGDYIIRGLKGEFYPCKPDIFDIIYERVGDLRAASVDTRPEGGDSTEIEAPFTSGAVPKVDAQTTQDRHD